MRTNNRILKIRHSNFPNIAFVAGNGEYRTIDIKRHFKRLNLSEKDFGYQIIQDKALFNTVTLEDNALAWKQLSTTISLPSGKTMPVFFHLDPAITLQNSELETKKANYQIGYKIKSERILQDLSQEELAYKIGSSKHYISKLENSKTDFEFKTLQKIFEVGLDKKIHLSIYGRKHQFRDISNSVLSIVSQEWLKQKQDDLTLIEGIGVQQCIILKSHKLTTPLALSQLEFVNLLELLTSSKKSLSSFKHMETWILQATLMVQGEWMSLITLQRAINGNSSKIEALLKAELGDEVYGI